jgi:hypothetical protein
MTAVHLAGQGNTILWEKDLTMRWIYTKSGVSERTSMLVVRVGGCKKNLTWSLGVLPCFACFCVFWWYPGHRQHPGVFVCSSCPLRPRRGLLVLEVVLNEWFENLYLLEVVEYSDHPEKSPTQPVRDNGGRSLAS